MLIKLFKIVRLVTFLLDASDDANLVTISNLLLGDISGYLNAKHIELKDTPLSMERLELLARKFDQKEISSKIVKEIFRGCHHDK